jgi:hypothetical protein
MRTFQLVAALAALAAAAPKEAFEIYAHLLQQQGEHTEVPAAALAAEIEKHAKADPAMMAEIESVYEQVNSAKKAEDEQNDKEADEKKKAEAEAAQKKAEAEAAQKKAEAEAAAKAREEAVKAAEAKQKMEAQAKAQAEAAAKAKEAAPKAAAPAETKPGSPFGWAGPLEPQVAQLVAAALPLVAMLEAKTGVKLDPEVLPAVMAGTVVGALLLVVAMLPRKAAKKKSDSGRKSPKKTK